MPIIESDDNGCVNAEEQIFVSASLRALFSTDYTTPSAYPPHQLFSVPLYNARFDLTTANLSRARHRISPQKHLYKQTHARI